MSSPLVAVAVRQQLNGPRHYQQHLFPRAVVEIYL